MTQVIMSVARTTVSIKKETEYLSRVHLLGVTKVRIAGPSPISIIVVLLAFCGDLAAQNPQLKTRAGSRFPTVIFTSALWSADPGYYSIAVDAAGTATYQSAPESLERTGVPYTIEFHVSDRTRRTIFNVVRQLDFFRGEIPAQQISTA